MEPGTDLQPERGNDHRSSEQRPARAAAHGGSAASVPEAAAKPEPKPAPAPALLRPLLPPPRRK